MSKTLTRTANLSTEEKRALLAQLLRKKDRESNSFPLSFAQERLWFLDQWESNSPAYNIPAAVRLRGPLNVTALEQSVNDIVRRHEALRTTFAALDGEPVQVIAPAKPLSLVSLDLRALPEDEREAEALRLATEEAQRPFDLAQGPLLRATLLRLGEEEHIALLTMHHIASDGWSMGVLIREVAALYQAFSTGEPSPLPELPIQYADFAVWQRQWLQGEVLEAQLAYWKQQLADIPVLELPTDRPRPAIQTSRGAHQSLELSQTLTEALKALSRQEGVTLYMTLLAVFKALLHRYTGQDDIVVGSPIANRNRTEIEGLIGFFVNTLVLRTDLSGDPSFRELLGRVREVALGAYAHQDLPFEKLVEELQPERDMSHQPMFQAMFALQNAPMEVLELPHLTLSPLEIESGTAKFDLTLVMVDTEQGLTASLEYNTDLFDATTIARLLEHFQILLKGIAANPDQRLLDLSLLTGAERHQLLVERNDTRAEYPKGVCIHQFFEVQAEQTPDAVAVVFPSISSGHSEDELLTYRELNRRANQLAHHLQALGVGPGALVGIYTEHSPETVVSILGILKAGGAYVPLEPASPKKHLDFILEDTQTPVLLTHQRLMTRLPEYGTQVLCLDSDWETIAQESDENPASGVTADNLAYLIYTSGSTGQPKGVKIQHSSLVNYIWWAKEVYPRGERLAFPLYSSLAFDLTVTSIFTPLITGNKLVIYPQQGRESPLQKILQDNRVGVLKLTPSHLALIKDKDNRDSQVKRLIVGGEAFDTNLANQVYNSFGGKVEIFNEYGPTEATVGCMIYRFDPATDNRAFVPIGKPAANVQIYILDEPLNPVAENVTGELYISGDGLAQGYLNREELTLERFIDNPFIPGSKMYKTGDLARWLPQGDIEFLGRADDQVKFHGYRVELNGIRCTLNQHPQVRNSVVVAEKNKNGHDVMIAYYVSRQELESAQLRAFLSESIIEETIPNLFVHLERMPLTSNGKINYRALPTLEEARQRLKRTFVAPRTPVEEILIAIWAQVLVLKQVSVYDNFFELGGHSLLATQIISRVRDAFQVELPLRRLFETPTVAGLAEGIEVAMRAKRGLPAPPMLPLPRDRELPLSFAQERLWFLDQLEPDSPAYNIPAAVRIRGSLNVTALEQSVNDIVRRHKALRTTFATVDGEPVQVIAPAKPLSLVSLDLRALPEDEREAEALRLATEEAQRPFDLAQGPLLRATLLRLGEEEHIALLTMHHIASDGWSMGVLIREVAALYQAFSTGEPSPLPELPIQYADFAVWQRQWLQGEVLEAQLAYWKQQLADIPVLELPTDRPRPAIQTSRGAHQSLELSQTLTEALKALSRQEGVTLYMTLLAVFKALLHRYTGQDDIVVGSPIANRNRTEIEGLIGFFVNTLVLRTDLSGDPSFRELLGRVREVALGAYAHQDLPFEKLVEELQPERDMSHTPLFQVMFVFQNTPMEVLELPDLTLSPLEIETRIAQFDLALFMEDIEQGLIEVLEYNTDLFDAATIARLLGHFQALLESIVANPDQRLSDLPLLTEAERRQLLVEWNDTQAEYPKDACIHQLFEAQVERTPDAVAVVLPSTDPERSEDGQLTYRELNRQANQLAHRLRAMGVGPEVRVGMCVERSLEMAVGFLGTLKAGGAYVPLDPAYPKERLAFMLEDLQTPVLLTHQRLMTRLPEYETQVICLDSDWETIAHESDENPASGVTADNLAYVIYTSGSTGKPKGVMIQHTSLVSYTETACDEYAVKPSDRILQFASLSFDASAEEIYPCLVRGATLVLRTDSMLSSASVFLQTCQHRALTVLNLPTAYWHELTARLDAEILTFPPSVRLVIIGGERALPERLAAWRQHVGQRVPLMNTYGPTEATIVATMCQLTGSAEADTVLPEVPIGRAIRNVQTYVLNRHLQPMPIGIRGELHIGGVGLSRGYLDRPELTAEQLVPNPFSDEPGARLYKTGDLARYLPDGNIEFLGRIDHQVKVRGFRVELGEIETVLGQHPAVREIVALAREDLPGDKRLVAYVVPNQEAPPTASELRGFAQDKLPGYMVPSTFVTLDTLPLTPSSKVDRQALPAPDRARPELAGALVAPRDTLEFQLTRIWEAALNIQPIGVRDDFFKLGGHSLLAVRLFALIEKGLGRRLPLAMLFQGATVEHLASLLRQRAESIPWSPLVEIQSSGSKPPFFCVHPAGGNVLCYVDLARHLGPEQPFYGLQSRGLDGEQEPHTQVEAMAAHYIEALRAVQPEGPYFLGGWSMGGIVAFEMAQQLRAQGQEVALLALLDTWAPKRRRRLAKEDSVALLVGFAQELGLSLDDLTLSWDRLLQLEPDKQLAYVLEGARMANMVPPDIEFAQIQRFFHVFKTNARAMRNYAPQPYPGRLILFSANELAAEGAHYVPQSRVRRLFHIFETKVRVRLKDSTLGWSKLSTEGVENYENLGNHFTMIREPHVQVLAERLRTCLAEAQISKLGGN